MGSDGVGDSGVSNNNKTSDRLAAIIRVYLIFQYMDRLATIIRAHLIFQYMDRLEATIRAHLIFQYMDRLAKRTVRTASGEYEDTGRPDLGLLGELPRITGHPFIGARRASIN